MRDADAVARMAATPGGRKAAQRARGHSRLPFEMVSCHHFSLLCPARSHMCTQRVVICMHSRARACVVLPEEPPRTDGACKIPWTPQSPPAHRAPIPLLGCFQGEGRRHAKTIYSTSPALSAAYKL